MRLKTHWQWSKSYSSPRALAISGFIVLTVGFLALISSAALAVSTGYFIKHSIETMGTVTALSEERDEKSQTVLYAPVYSFVTEDGRTRSVASTTYSSPSGFQVGDRVAVLYRAVDPAGARIHSFGELWFLPISLAAIGLMLGILSAMLLLSARRKVLKLAAEAPL